jgi:hypothetical protein
MFDPSVADGCVPFFRTALARDAAARHHTAAGMLAAWQAIFVPVPRTAPDDADQRAARATAGTPLTEAGLSARALSALEPYGVATAGDLAAVDPVRLNRLSGVAEATRREVKARARLWRQTLAAGVRPVRPAPAAGTLADPAGAAALLSARAGKTGSNRRRAAGLVLGLDGELDPFATQAEIGGALGLTRGRVAQLVPELQDRWASDDGTRGLLDAVAGLARDTVARLGGVATVGELADGVLAHLPPCEDEARGGRLAAGLVRVALERVDALARAAARVAPRRTG